MVAVRLFLVNLRPTSGAPGVARGTREGLEQPAARQFQAQPSLILPGAAARSHQSHAVRLIEASGKASGR